MGYSGKYKPVKGLGKPKNIREAKVVERRLETKYPGMKKKHAAAVKATGEPWWIKLKKRASKYIKEKAEKDTTRTKAITSGLKVADLSEKEIAKLRGK